jgi:hypothetical protein
MNGCSFPGVKRPGREADHSPPFSTEVKNAWSCTYTPPIRLHGVDLTKMNDSLVASNVSFLGPALYTVDIYFSPDILITKTKENVWNKECDPLYSTDCVLISDLNGLTLCSIIYRHEETIGISLMEWWISNVVKHELNSCKGKSI